MAPKRKGPPPRRAVGSRQKVWLLDQFNEADVAHWRQEADAKLEYATRVYFHFEAERRLRADAIRDSLASAPALRLRLDGWIRVVDYAWSSEPLSAAGSLRRGGRFNVGKDLDATRFPSFPALYLAEDYETAYAEKFGSHGKRGRDTMTGADFALRSPASFTSIRLNGHIRHIFDLTVTASLRRFVKIIASFQLTRELLALAEEAKLKKPYTIETPRQLKAQLLTDHWRANPVQFGVPANSQIFATLVRDAGFEGILYQSVRGPRRCVALFPDRLAHDESYVELADTAPSHVTCRRLDAKTWTSLAPKGM